MKLKELFEAVTVNVDDDTEIETDIEVIFLDEDGEELDILNLTGEIKNVHVYGASTRYTDHHGEDDYWDDLEYIYDDAYLELDDAGVKEVDKWLEENGYQITDKEEDFNPRDTSESTLTYYVDKINLD